MAIVQEMQRFYGLKRLCGAHRRDRGWRVKYRAGGHYLIRRWIRENADYIERLRSGFYHSSGTGAGGSASLTPEQAKSASA
jgi:hypothetical protein